MKDVKVDYQIKHLPSGFWAVFCNEGGEWRFIDAALPSEEAAKNLIRTITTATKRRTRK